MGKLYIANCTRQNQRVMYRLDFDQKGERYHDSHRRMARHQDIPMGRQVALGGDLHVTQIEDIIQQLNVFGMVGTVDLNRPLKGFVPYLFSIDKPVSVDNIRRVHAHNDGALKTEGVTRRRDAAVAASAVIGTNSLEVSIEQETASEMDEDLIGEGFRVTDDKPATNAKGRSKSRSSRPQA